MRPKNGRQSSATDNYRPETNAMIRFGALSAARITPDALLYPCMNEPGASVSAVAARDQARAQAFASAHRIPAVASDYQALINRDDVDAVYIALPINLHLEWTLKALQAGKHVLCEKAIACNEQEARQMAEAAAAAGRVLMEAFHYRYHPLFEEARRIYHSGQLGTIRHINAVFTTAINDPEDIRMNYATAGGVTMDIGCYPLSWIRHLTGAEPEVTAATAITGPDRVDVMLSTELQIDDIAVTTTGDMRPGTRTAAYIEVQGSRGSMRVINPLAPQMGHAIITDIDGEKHTFTTDRRTSYCYQLDAFLAAVTGASPIATGAEDAVRQMALTDACYLAAGLPLRGL
ncbi:MAG: Gfo/Idh/MocA family oxidoreductase [Pseudomonadales bacterium]|nr:Gfo/Idh/MocA family oxidoreductase [Pseudomonadales bacterium]